MITSRRERASKWIPRERSLSLPSHYFRLFVEVGTRIQLRQERNIYSHDKPIRSPALQERHVEFNRPDHISLLRSFEVTLARWAMNISFLRNWGNAPSQD